MTQDDMDIYSDVKHNLNDDLLKKDNFFYSSFVSFNPNLYITQRYSLHSFKSSKGVIAEIVE
jgi:hypothetical protein